MKMDEIMNFIHTMSYSQGFYTRLYNNIMELKETDKEGYKKLKTVLEKQHFNDNLDIIFYFEG